jgi:acetate kinase
MREKGHDPARLERLITEESGLRGISGITSDMKTLLERRTHDPRAAMAVAMFCDSIRTQVGAFAAVLGGVDTLVFTGGIGERAAEVRWEICRGLDHLGVRLHPQRNADHADRISSESSRRGVRVIATNEDLQIARHTYALIQPVTPTTGR